MEYYSEGSSALPAKPAWMATPEAAVETAARVVNLASDYEPDYWSSWRMQGAAQRNLFDTMPQDTPEQRKKAADVLNEAIKSFLKASHLAGEAGNAHDQDVNAERVDNMIPIRQRLLRGGRARESWVLGVGLSSCS